MKKGKILLGLILLLTTTISVIAKNNTYLWHSSIDDEKTVTAIEVYAMVNKELVAPIEAAYRREYPSTFNTKCFSMGIYLEMKGFQGPDGLHFQTFGNDEILKTANEITFDKNEWVPGRVNLMLCNSHPSIICEVKTLYKDSKIMVRDSYLEEWIDYKEFLNSFSDRLKQLEH